MACIVMAQPRQVPRPAPQGAKIPISSQWRIQSSAVATQSGDVLSSREFNAASWYPARVPSTVVRALIDNGVYADPYFGANLRAIPGTEYEVGDNFSNVPIPADSPFAVSWWYRSQVRLNAMVPGDRLWLNFDSINYRANIWLNGHLVAADTEVRGMYRSYEFDVTDIAQAGINVLAVEVFPPSETDLAITFVDWNPLPADKDMGIVRDVYIRRTGPVTVRNPQVITRLSGGLDEARLSLYADLRNAGGRAIDGTLTSTIGTLVVSRQVHLEAGELRHLAILPENEPLLRIQDPQLWWPYGLGPQNLHQLRMEFVSEGVISDRQDVQFGIREFSSELDSNRHRVFSVNGKRILIRGAGYTHDMMLRVDAERKEYEMRYAREMHLNTLRLEGKMLDDHFFDLADRYGILIMPGWCCCDFWEQWARWKPEHYTVAAESMRTQIRRLRNHASVFVFLYGSDAAPDPAAERVYLDTLAEERWPNPYLSAARDSTTVGAGLTGVKMNGPYDWVPPNYWLLDQRWGGAWGFNTETSPGHAIPVLESLREMFPADHLWPPDEFWRLHETTYIPNMEVYRKALDARYGASSGIEDFVKKSQAMAYEGERAMFEAFRRNKYTATGVIQWMCNNAWPSIAWHLYDYYLRPGGGYFGTRKANEPLHAQYSYDDRSIVVVNSGLGSYAGYRVTAKVYNLDLTEKFSQGAGVDIAEDSATRVFLLPQIAGLSRTWFLRLILEDPDGNRVSSNFYWLSTQDDAVDFPAQTEIAYTPIRQYADLTDLQSLPPATVSLVSRFEDSGSDRIEHVVLRNTSTVLAFQVRLSVWKEGGGDIAPVYWDDNYFELFPGERREVTAVYPRKLLENRRSQIHLDGWNVAPAVN